MVENSKKTATAKKKVARKKKTSSQTQTTTDKEKVAIDMSSIPFFNLQGRFVHVTVGNNERPATSDDIQDIQEKLENLAESNGIECLFFVTHHAVEVKFVV